MSSLNNKLLQMETSVMSYLICRNYFVSFMFNQNSFDTNMKRYIINLKADERAELEAIIRKGSHRSQKVINALVLLNCDKSKFNESYKTGAEIAGVLRISMRRVDRIKKRFVEDGLDAALGNRQGRRATYLRKADGDFEAHLVALSCGPPPEGHAQWSLRLLADQVVELGYIESVSHETIRRVLKKNDLKPWRRIGWVIPPQNNADFVAAMERVLDLYRRPYDPYYPVICMDETPRQLIGETRKAIPPAPGSPARYDYEYRRLGTCNVFMATEPLVGVSLKSPNAGPKLTGLTLCEILPHNSQMPPESFW